jgi:hypothetical protein
MNEGREDRVTRYVLLGVGIVIVVYVLAALVTWGLG